MKTVRRGDQGSAVKILQNYLGIMDDDGYFGPKTERAVVMFQMMHDLFADGIVGPITWSVLQASVLHKTLGWSTVKADRFKEGYTRFTLRTDVAEDFREMRAALERNYRGDVPITSSGSKRSLRSGANQNRSATSLHYLGLAFDLYVYSAFDDHKNDPYLIERDGRYWTVYARASCAGEQTVNAYNFRTGKSSKVTAAVINLTQHFAEYGFLRIPSRPSFDRGVYGGAEWWHFEQREKIEEGSTFGAELLKVYGAAEAHNSPVWRHSERKWNGSRFE